MGESVGFDNGYRGDYIYDIARIVRVEHGDRWFARLGWSTAASSRTRAATARSTSMR
jgi:hypothetical protein